MEAPRMRVYLDGKTISGPDVTWADLCNPRAVVTEEGPEQLFSIDLMQRIGSAPHDALKALGINYEAISERLRIKLSESGELPGQVPNIVEAQIDNERQASILYDKQKNPVLSQMRGGICFPTVIQLQGDKIGGFILLAGRDVDGVVTVYGQQEYMVIDNILDSQHRILYNGVSGFMNDGWSRFFCRIYYWSQPFAMVRRYRLDIQQSDNVEPKPTLVEVDLAEAEDAYLSIWRLFHTRRLRITGGSPLHRAINRYKKSSNRNDIEPAIHALHCALMGFDKLSYLTL